MRIAIVSDIHGNLTAFEAVLADLKRAAPDLVMHGGDLADSCSAPAEVIDRIAALGWPGVSGNTDEMLFRPESLNEFAAASAGFQPLLPMVEEIAAAARDLLGPQRLDWLRALPRAHVRPELAVVHASPESCWRSPAPEAGDDEFERVYSPLGSPVVVYGHVHRPFVRRVGGLIVINSGSVGMPYDGDPRAGYLLLDEGRPAFRRVPYDVQREIDALNQSARPHAAWIARILTAAAPQMP